MWLRLLNKPTRATMVRVGVIVLVGAGLYMADRYISNQISQSLMDDLRILFLLFYIGIVALLSGRKKSRRFVVVPMPPKPVVDSSAQLPLHTNHMTDEEWSNWVKEHSNEKE